MKLGAMIRLKRPTAASSPSSGKSADSQQDRPFKEEAEDFAAAMPSLTGGMAIGRAGGGDGDFVIHPVVEGRIISQRIHEKPGRV